MTRIRLGAGKGSWSAACSTRVARSASIAIGLSKSAIRRTTDRPTGRRRDCCAAARPGRSSRVLPADAVSRGTESGRCTCSTWNRVERSARRRRHRAPRVMTTTVVAASPSPAPTARGCTSRIPAASSSGTSAGQLLERPGADEGDQLGARPQQAAAPADQPGERRDGPGGDDVDRPDGGDHRRAPRPGRGRPASGSPRAPIAASSATASSRNSTRRAIGSTSVSVRSGRASAERDAGQPGAAADVDDAGALRAPPRPPPRC